MSDKINIYECDELMRQIESKAEENGGEISDEDMHMIVKAQTSSMEQLGKLIHYVKYLEGLEVMAKNEIERIQKKRKAGENRIEGIKRWLRPYIEKHGPVNIGTHRISLRKSYGVVLADGFDNPMYCKVETLVKPDKKAIKECIQGGVEVQGAVLELRSNVQIR